LTEAEVDSAAALRRAAQVADPALREWIRDLMWQRVDPARREADHGRGGAAHACHRCHDAGTALAGGGDGGD